MTESEAYELFRIVTRTQPGDSETTVRDQIEHLTKYYPDYPWEEWLAYRLHTIT